MAPSSRRIPQLLILSLKRAAFTAWDRTLQRPRDAHPELAGTALGHHYREWLERADDAAWWATRPPNGP